jgi:hypothetical protein
MTKYTDDGYVQRIDRSKHPAFPQNRRPNSLLDNMGKVMEKAMYKQIYPKLSRHIPDEQFAFLSRRETTLQLLRLTEHVTENFIHSDHISRRIKSL